MADALLQYLRASLPQEVANLAASHLSNLEQGQFESLLHSTEARILFGQEKDASLDSIKIEDFPSWSDWIFHRLGVFCGDRSKPEKQVVLFCIGYAALLTFVQSNVTGPPLEFQPSALVLSGDGQKVIQQRLLHGLSVDGIAAYKLTPHIELLCLADAVMTCPAVLKNVKAARWAKLRVSFLHQRLLSEVSSTLQDVIYDDLELLQEDLASFQGDRAILEAEFVLERATIHIHHGLDKFARSDLDQATEDRQFEFALTGLLGKRTKYQEKDMSQLVVLAKSHESGESNTSKVSDSTSNTTNGHDSSKKPQNLDLNDDTLLESISFSEKPAESVATEIRDSDSLPPALKAIDPSDQPQLQPVDSTILLLLASSITNTSPANGLTREETIPYATRVLEGGSSNWQVYTQALLVRSRIEGYRSRTIERGLLQLQALVDQVIADTTGAGSSGKEDADAAAQTSTFLPKAKEDESAPVTERLRYIFQLATPTRWELEAELASRWVQLGGLRSALEIYERLQMWAEAALCWAATEREEKAKRVVRRQLFHATDGATVPEDSLPEDEEWTGPARDPSPLDAPRLYCILGDIDQSVEMYERAWEVSNQRYARAQRSIGRHFFSAGDMLRAADAYSKSLKVNQLNEQSWFALGCALLELAQFEKAAEAFSRCVQLDETDAEAWSNLAAALLRTDPDSIDIKRDSDVDRVKLDDEDESVANDTSTAHDRQNSVRQEALAALKRAAKLKHDSHRIWSNVLVAAASLSPPDYTSILAAQKRIIDLRGPTEGEKCIDVEIVSALVNHIIITNDTYNPEQPGLARMTVKFVDQSIVPLITASAELWQLVAKLALWRNKPSTALDAEEKAWRAVTTQLDWETGESEARWNEVVEATVRLCEAYESFGPKERTEGMAAASGEVVMKDWNFKARSAVRGIMGRGKESWDGTEGWDRLKDVMEGLRG